LTSRIYSTDGPDDFIMSRDFFVTQFRRTSKLTDAEEYVDIDWALATVRDLPEVDLVWKSGRGSLFVGHVLNLNLIER
jgi:hypothetical protein